jgi:hypothetical protein
MDGYRVGNRAAGTRSGSASLSLTPNSAAREPKATWQISIEGIDWPGVTTGLYLLVSGALLLKLLVGLAMLVRFARLITVLPAGARVCASELVAVPVTFASVIIVPSDWETWSGVQQRAVLAHELSHVVRGDFYTLLLASLYRIVFWFNPLSWWLLHQLGQLMGCLATMRRSPTWGTRRPTPKSCSTSQPVLALRRWRSPWRARPDCSPPHRTYTGVHRAAASRPR